MKYQHGFTLFELMIAIAVIAILSAIAVPSYQGYMQKAAMTDVLQTVNSYRIAVELCYLEKGSVQSCAAGQSGIPTGKATRYVQSLLINQGQITAVGQNILQGLSIVLVPEIDTTTRVLNWKRDCQFSGGQSALIDACKSVFRFADN